MSLAEFLVKAKAAGAIGITSDSRGDLRGKIFAAYPGELKDGRHYIADALKNGAVAVLYEATLAQEIPALSFALTHLKASMSNIAAEVYGHPAKRLRLIGVTGTNGKTSVAYSASQMLSLLGLPCAMIGTLGYGTAEALSPTANTTPDAAQMQAMLSELVAVGKEAVVMEVSSHALVQGRVAALPFEVAVFTNLTQDHLDYHKTMEAYQEAKAMLFVTPSLKMAVVNEADPAHKEMCRKSHAKVLGFGLLSSALAIGDEVVNADGVTARLTYQGTASTFSAPLLGHFNLSNLYAAVGIGLALGFSLEAITATLPKLKGVPGRMQKVSQHSEPLVLVDYAHTPDGLEKALATAKAIAPENRLSAVIGCGGDRDKGKRPLMAQVAKRYADSLLFTTDNPRSEAPEAIIADMQAGLSSSAKVILDRGEAIAHVIKHAGQNETIVIAGKGHEKTQEVMGVKHPFDDVLHARIALDEWRGS